MRHCGLHCRRIGLCRIRPTITDPTFLEFACLNHDKDAIVILRITAHRIAEHRLFNAQA